ncbi:MAG: hypothetical protein NVS3B2_17160 [Ramlibacter sp.]
MLVSTAYSLPFEFRFSAPPLWGAGVKTRVRIVLHAGEGVEALRPDLQMKLMSFGVLCATGAFGIIAPEGFDPVTPLFESAQMDGTSIEWTLPDWPASNDCLPVLASLYAAEDVAWSIARIEIVRGSDASSFDLAWEEHPVRSYPAAVNGLPFAWSIDNEGQDDIRVGLHLARTPGEGVRAEIEKRLQLWAHAASAGAYGVAPVDPLKCSFIFDEFVDWFDDRLTWQLRRFRAHSEALDGLVNVVANIHANLWPIAGCHFD